MEILVFILLSPMVLMFALEYGKNITSLKNAEEERNSGNQLPGVVKYGPRFFL